MQRAKWTAIEFKYKGYCSEDQLEKLQRPIYDKKKKGQIKSMLDNPCDKICKRPNVLNFIRSINRELIQS